MKKRKVKIYDENWNLESEHFVEIPTTRLEKQQQLREKEIKDFLYSISIFRNFAYKFLKWSDKNARKNVR